MGGWAEGQACADLEGRTHIAPVEILYFLIKDLAILDTIQSKKHGAVKIIYLHTDSASIIQHLIQLIFFLCIVPPTSHKVLDNDWIWLRMDPRTLKDGD